MRGIPFTARSLTGLNNDARATPSHGRSVLAEDFDDGIKHAAAEWTTRADAGLSSAEEADLKAWLAADPRHRAALARFDSVWSRFDRPVMAGVATELLEELDSRAVRRHRGSRISVAVVMLLLLGLWFRSSGDRNSGLLDRAATNAVLLLPARQILPDGSVVELKEGAEIAADFTAAVRRVTLRRGEAHFDVVKNPGRPFVVAAKGVEVRAVGTAFTVELRSSAVEVLVTEGSVAVNQATGPSSASRSPGEAPPSDLIAVLSVRNSIVVDTAAQAATPSQVTTVLPDELDQRLAWRAPRAEFTRTSLPEAVAILNGYSAGRRSSRQRAVQFIIEDPALASVRVSGLFRVDNTDAFVGLLKEGFGIEAEARGETVIVLRKAL